MDISVKMEIGGVAGEENSFKFLDEDDDDVLFLGNNDVRCIWYREKNWGELEMEMKRNENWVENWN